MAKPLPKHMTDRIQETTKLLDGQIKKLAAIHEEYKSAFDSAFDRVGAVETLERWITRTISLLEQRLCAHEAKRIQLLWREHRGLTRSFAFERAVNALGTFLVRLIEDIADHPGDPNFTHLREPSPANSMPSAQPPAPISYDVFLSYSTHDKDEARRIHDSLVAKKQRCFLTERNLKPGDLFSEEIRLALVQSREAWILVTPSSNKSTWVQREIGAAWGLGKKIVPILFRCSHDDLPDGLADRHTIDFHDVI